MGRRQTELASLAIAVAWTVGASPGCSPKEGAECKVETKLTCEDPRVALACHGGKWEREPCKGPRGCGQDNGDTVCDHSVAESSDGCTINDDHSCAPDKKSMVRCSKYRYSVVATCLGPEGCVRADKEAKCDNSAAEVNDLCTQEADLACSLDAKSTLACKNGKMTLDLPCKGKKGCSVAGTSVRCDDSVSDLDDPCASTPGKDHYACASDQKSLLRCDRGKFVQSDKCLGAKTCKLLGDVVGCSM